ncbi:MAG: hypothetical protein LBL45_01365 [Treponema sp.]|nr:hypothetical protein [Treponema sp.]
MKWLKALDHKSQTKVIRCLMRIHKYGKYGKDSHRCESQNLIYEIVIKTPPLRVYFTVIDDKRIRLDDGSSTKSGQGGEQDRTIEAIDRLVTQRGY